MKLPICDICNKSVDRIRRDRDVVRDVEVYTAECHGDKEICILTQDEMEECINIELGRAFITKRLVNA